MKTKIVICFTGPSGIGKTSYINRLISKYDFASPITATTRQKRDDDKEGHYLYVDEALFKSMLNNGCLLEWDQYSYYFYGIIRQNFEELLSKNFSGVVLDLTPDSCRNLIKMVPDAIIIALLPNDFSCLRRQLINRNTQTMEEIQSRLDLLNDYMDKIDSLICNRIYVGFSPESWDSCFLEIEKIIFSP